ncbi:MAG: DUF1587 domain-containing protein, partial [Planctomycetaceae bacterium]|nr:DUF1587 domain-containing protein [Planctomycetaceae bacterium]
MRKLFVWLICLAAVGTWAGGGLPAADAADVPPNGQHDPVLAAPVATQTLLAQYCVSCHTGSTPSGDLMLQSSDSANANPNGKPEPITLSTTVWERVVRKLRSGQMPPADADQPEPSASSTAIAHLERALDEPAEKHPRPGRTETLRRLTRTEYANAVRDLLDLRINAEDLLPVDEASHGFDNITVGELSPALLNRYVTAAQKIARMAVGSPGYGAVSETYRVRPDITQEHHLPGLPLGTRGGTLIPHNFPRNGNYEIQVRLTRDRNEHVEGLNDEHELVVLVDRREAERFVVRPPKDRRDHSKVDAHLHTTARISSGPHDLAVTFAKRSASLIETERQPTAARFNMHRHPRTGPAILEVTITGPIGQSDTGDSPSRHRLFAPLIAETENGENGPKEGT